MDFAVIYRSCKRTQALGRGLKAVQENLDRLGLEYVSVVDAKIDTFRTIHGFKLTTLDGSAFFPAQPLDVTNSGVAWMRSAFAEADIVVPPYYQMGFLHEHAGKILRAETHLGKMDAGSTMLAYMYPASGMAALIAGVWSKRKSFELFHAQVVESAKAYCLGLYGVAITGLLPCVEGVVRELGVLSGVPVGDSVSIRILTKVFRRLQRKELESMLDGYDWYPEAELNIALLDGFHERVQMFESISSYLQSRLYLHTEVAPEYLTLNRHGIAHGLFQGYATKENYLRLFNLMSALSFAAAMAEGRGSLMHPGTSPESDELTDSFDKCGALSLLI
ncbi:hypothetical protein K3F44_08925 [Pseudomonas sp. S07E 245]|uniref:hypothetical protein n=1 Tax=Pseudomonas sp. S07E 245 TaxID=2866278 RepID=UPI001C72EF8C|nr:hypothetical protein [Pseudomonas sp. S07E 245]QYX54397.1 hypothetical protein K3F44_08925 [Pseudomonas sp. S07E 245]